MVLRRLALHIISFLKGKCDHSVFVPKSLARFPVTVPLGVKDEALIGRDAVIVERKSQLKKACKITRFCRLDFSPSHQVAPGILISGIVLLWTASIRAVFSG
jgi:hypothetical protein